MGPKFNNSITFHAGARGSTKPTGSRRPPHQGSHLPISFHGTTATFWAFQMLRLLPSRAQRPQQWLSCPHLRKAEFVQCAFRWQRRNIVATREHLILFHDGGKNCQKKSESRSVIFGGHVGAESSRPQFVTRSSPLLYNPCYSTQEYVRAHRLWRGPRKCSRLGR